jgi:hypothetical protein
MAKVYKWIILLIIIITSLSLQKQIDPKRAIYSEKIEALELHLKSLRWVLNNTKGADLHHIKIDSARVSNQLLWYKQKMEEL